MPLKQVLDHLRVTPEPIEACPFVFYTTLVIATLSNVELPLVPAYRSDHYIEY